MKTAKLIELQRERLDLIGEARDVLREMQGETDSKKLLEMDAKHADLMRQVDANDLDIAEERMLAEGEAEREARRPNQSGECHGADGGYTGPFSLRGGTDMGWRDQRGETVKVYTRDDCLAERRSDVSVGDLVRAKITGPRNDAEKRALSEGTDSAGGYTVPAYLASEFIDKLRANSVAVRAGAITVPMESETLAMARLTGDPTVAWRAENAAIAEGDPTFDRVTFTAKTLAGGIKLSRELAEDSLNVGRMIENALAQAAARQLDFGAIYGDGTSNAPTGITNTSGINTVSMGTNGAALASYDKLIDAVYEMQVDNAADPTAMIMHPRTGVALAKLKDADNNPLVPPEMIGRIPRLTTTAAAIDETEGTAVDASSIVLGNFRELMIGMRHSMEIRVFDQTYASTGQLYVVVWLRADVQLAHPVSFCTLTGIIPA
jgi:HK97 family phage major capsid protein